MINSLTTADPEKNATTTSGNIKLTTLTQTIGLNTVDTIFRWTYTINGADYTAIGVTFRNGAFYALRDDSNLYKIGNTDVNITSDQAIALALNYVQTYSYTGITGSEEDPKYVEISDFNITKERITAELGTYPHDTSTLYPYWSVQLPLEENYPGNVWALLVSVWADSGQVFLCQPLAVGGSLNDTTLTELPLTSPIASSASENSAATPLDIGMVTLVLTVIAVATLVVVSLIVKKRR